MRPAAVASMVVLVTGCGSADNSGYALDVGGDDAGNPTLVVGDAAATQGLDAYIEQGQVAVKLVTLGCAGGCATVQAVGTGGHPPYTYAWDNGSTNPVRQVCPTADTGYSVKVTDTGMTGEVPRPAQTAKASVTADVLACPGGGSSDAGDARSGLACLSNPSFEGTPANDAVDAPPWVACGNQATIVNPTLPFPAQPLLQPTDGNTALFLRATDGLPPPGAVSEPLCAPMHAGLQYHLTMDVASTPEVSFGGVAPPEGLQIWAGTSSCAEGELLWTSPPGGASWTSVCATLSPTTEVTYLTLVAYQSPDAGPAIAAGNLQADHMVAVAACP